MYDGPVAARDLLDHYFAECERKFRFIEQQHGFSYLSGLAEYRNNSKIIRPYGGREIGGGEFMAITRYERGDVALEIQYGEARMAMECFVYFAPAQRFSLTEILTAARKAPKGKVVDWGITRSILIDENISRLSRTVQTHHKLVLDPGPKMLERMATIRDIQIEQAVRRQFTEMIRKASTQAAIAFREKNYREVVSMLEPYRNHLPAAELKKLQLARRQLVS
jgi:hypothetical protein